MIRAGRPALAPAGRVRSRAALLTEALTDLSLRWKSDGCSLRPVMTAVETLRGFLAGATLGVDWQPGRQP